MKLGQALLPLLPLATIFVVTPVRAETCATEAESITANDAALAQIQGGAAAAQAALGKLETLRKSTFEKYVYSEEYGYVSFLAEQARRAKDDRLQTL